MGNINENATISVSNIVDTLDEFPLLSESASQIIQLVENPDCSANKIAKIVHTDAILTAKLLKVINSAHYSLKKEIDSVAQAIAYLGNSKVVQIAINTSTQEIFDRKLQGYLSEKGDLWEHSLKTAIAAKELSFYCKQDVNPDLAFTSGLLHDIGKSIISQYLSNNNEGLSFDLKYFNNENFLQVEKSAIGLTHCDIGFELAKKWNLSESIKSVIKYHHSPGKINGKYQALVYCVHLGDILSMMSGSGTGSDSLQYQLDSSYTNHIYISKKNIASLIVKIDIVYNRMANSLET